MPPKQISTADIIFPVLSGNSLSSTLSSLKRSTLSTSNRLHSIDSDAEFVCAVADAYRRPLVANERCGSWYIPLERKTASAYFKSTDGHMGEWSFSLRRLNVQVLEVAGKHDGLRRWQMRDSRLHPERKAGSGGSSSLHPIARGTVRASNLLIRTVAGMPDALSKTIPTWCAVWNRLLFPHSPEAHQLYTPRQSVSDSEHSQIAARLDSFVELAQELGLNLASLRAHLTKPLRPIWVTQESALPSSPPDFQDFHPVILCTSSRRVLGGEVSEGGYVQGAGDDAEGWACGLTPQLFWENKQQLLETAEGVLPDLISNLLEQYSRSESNAVSAAVPLEPATWLSVCPYASLMQHATTDFDAVISCTSTSDAALEQQKKSNHCHLKCTTGKLGSRDLRVALPALEAFMRDLPRDSSLVVSCETGKDISVGVALAVLCLYADERGTRTLAPNPSINKPFIKQRLSWIMTSFPDAKPSRATLQSVNAFLFSPRETEPMARSLVDEDKRA
ncbi:tRNA a64-2'-o-ribosylphosphate transferase-like protein [Phyllosticta citribraziliensis]|uniref:tRNA a64-2'-o-ribosylphosphate transferase-like protein n=1 Tax=Phyllosticta citribraziliensis TaxID=989973 RepID=A0ABR1LI12_9PEZI